MQKLSLLILVSILIVSCNNYGDKVSKGHVEVYYKDGITKEQAEKTASAFMFMENSNNTKDAPTKSFQLLKENDSFLIRMVADEAAAKAVPDVSFQAIALIVSDSAFNGQPVNIDISNNKFKPFKHISFSKNLAGSYNSEENVTGSDNQVFQSGNIQVMAGRDVTEVQAQELADFLENNMHPAQTISFQVLKNNNNIYTVRMASDPQKANSIPDQTIGIMAKAVSETIFGGQEVMYELTDTEFVPFKSVSSISN